MRFLNEIKKMFPEATSYKVFGEKVYVHIPTYWGIHRTGETSFRLGTSPEKIELEKKIVSSTHGA